MTPNKKAKVNDINVLAHTNAHERDQYIKFYEYGHKYEVLTDKNSKYTSVTTWIHQLFPKFNADEIITNIMKSKSWGPGHKYWGMTAEEIKQSWTNNGNAVATAGTNMHYNIECFMNNINLSPGYTHKDLLDYYLNNSNNKYDYDEWQFFLNFIKDFPHLKPYRTEWLIYDEDVKLSGSIDMVYENTDGTLSIYDWKRSKEISGDNVYNKFAIESEIKHIPDTNFWHYSLQLNLYKKLLERKYGKKVKELYLVRLHPNHPNKTYELIPVPSLDKEIQQLLNKRSNILFN
jgi:hypothetical protein